MKFLKTIVVLLFSLALMGSPFVFQGHSAQTDRKPKSCSCCACKKVSCCVTSAPVAPQEPIPVQSTRSVSSTELQVIAAAIELLVDNSSDKKFRSESNFPPASSVVAIPLYQQNCIYLI